MFISCFNKTYISLLFFLISILMPIHTVQKNIRLSQNAQKNIRQSLDVNTQTIEKYIIHEEDKKRKYHPFFDDILEISLKNGSTTNVQYLICRCDLPFDNTLIDEYQILRKLIKSGNIESAKKLIASNSINLTTDNHCDLLVKLLVYQYKQPELFFENYVYYTEVCPLLIEKGIPLNNCFKLNDKIVTALHLGLHCAAQTYDPIIKKKLMHLVLKMLDYGANPRIEFPSAHNDKRLPCLLRKRLLYASNLYSSNGIPLLLTGCKEEPSEEEYLKYKTTIFNNTHQKIVREVCDFKLFHRLWCLVIKHTDLDTHFSFV